PRAPRAVLPSPPRADPADAPPGARPHYPSQPAPGEPTARRLDRSGRALVGGQRGGDARVVPHPGVQSMGRSLLERLRRLTPLLALPALRGRPPAARPSHAEARRARARLLRRRRVVTRPHRASGAGETRRDVVLSADPGLGVPDRVHPGHGPPSVLQRAA